MIRYIAFLRGINVSGQKLIKMEALKQYFEMPGFKNVATYIQSGNVLFDSKETDAEKLRLKIEKQLAKQLGYDVPVVLRSIEEIKTVIKNSPIKPPAADSKQKLYVHFLSAVPVKGLDAALQAYRGAEEQIIIKGKEAYLLSISYGNTKLTNTLIEKKLGVTSTARNWATVNKVTML